MVYCTSKATMPLETLIVRYNAMVYCTSKATMPLETLIVRYNAMVYCTSKGTMFLTLYTRHIYLDLNVGNKRDGNAATFVFARCTREEEMNAHRTVWGCNCGGVTVGVQLWECSCGSDCGSVAVEV